MSDPERDAENEARLRRAYEAFNRGDFDQAVGEGVHPDFEYVPAAAQFGVTGAGRFRDWMEPDAFASQRVELLELTVRGDRALVHQRTHARGASSGVEVVNESWGVWTIDAEGLATRLQIFRADQEAEARRAAGLP